MEGEMSHEDLRNRLYHSMKEKGLVDSLKSQLRNKLVSELQQLGLSQTYQQKPVSVEDGSSLLLRASNSLVADHLRRCNYDYTHSVFLPESGTDGNKVFTTRDLLQLLNISPHSRLYKQLASTPGLHRKGFLWQLLSDLASAHGATSQDIGVQTLPVKLPAPTSLEEEFRKLDQHYSSVWDESKARGMLIEDRLLAYQRQLDERSTSELQLQIARFKENELQRMRLEEREKNRKEIEKIRKELEQAYQAKSDALTERERHSIERLQKQQEIQEKETFSQRQSILQDIEIVRQREAQLRRESDMQNREKNMFNEKLKSTQDSLKKREEAVRRAEIEYNQRLTNEIDKFKLEEQGRYLQRYKELEVREGRAKDDQIRLDEELQNIKLVKDEVRDRRVRCNELEADLHKSRHDALAYQKKTEIMSEKLREMVDYQVMKEENAVLKNEMDSLKMRCAELTKECMVERQKQEDLLREMTQMAGKPTPEVALLQRHLEKIRDELRQEQAVGEHQRQQLELRLRNEGHRVVELTKQLEDQTNQMGEMNHELADLRQQLGHTRTALSNEIYRKPIGTVHRDSFCGESNNMAPEVPRVSSEPTMATWSHGLADDLISGPTRSVPSGPTGGDTPSRSDDYSYSMDLVHETRQRLKNLESEAEKLEANYRNFQYRMTAVPSLPSDHDYHTCPAEPSPSRHKVSFRERPELHSPMASPQLTGSRSSGPHSQRDTVSTRPLSSTPYKHQAPSASRELQLPSTPPKHSQPADTGEPPLLDISVSTVHSVNSPAKEPPGRTSSSSRARPLSLDDLEARPGSPSVVVLQGSDGSPESHTTQSGQSTVMTAPVQQMAPLEQHPQPLSSQTAVRPVAVSLDDTWKQDTDAEARRREEERKREEELDQEWQEQRRRREEERQRKEQEAWEKEQRELKKFQQENETSPNTSALSAPKSSDDHQGAGEAQIDPMMQKYMAMVQEQKEKEKETSQKAVDTWKQGRKDKTPSHSEPDLSGLDEPKSEKSQGSDFEW